MKSIAWALMLLPAIVAAQGFPEDTDQIQKLTVQKAEELARREVFLSFDQLTEIDPDVACSRW